jgi:hypothetical protein
MDESLQNFAAGAIALKKQMAGTKRGEIKRTATLVTF